METGLKGFRSNPQASFASAFGFCLQKKKGLVEPFIRRKFNRWDDNKADNSVKRFFRWPTWVRQNAECGMKKNVTGYSLLVTG